MLMIMIAQKLAQIVNGLIIYRMQHMDEKIISEKHEQKLIEEDLENIEDIDNFDDDTNLDDTCN